MTDAKIKGFADRLIALSDAYRDDVEVVITDAKNADIDPAALRRLATWLKMDVDTRNERDSLDEHYRALATGERPSGAIPSMRLHRTIELVKAKKTIREIAKDLGVSVGKAHQLKVQAAMFTVHGNMNDEQPPHDPETGEITQTQEVQPAGTASGTAVNEAAQPAAVAIHDSKEIKERGKDDDERSQSGGSGCAVQAHSGCDSSVESNDPRRGDDLCADDRGARREPSESGRAVDCDVALGERGTAPEVAPGPQDLIASTPITSHHVRDITKLVAPESDLIADIGNIPPRLDRRASA